MKIIKYFIAIVLCAMIFSISVSAYDLTVQVRLSGGIAVANAKVYLFNKWGSSNVTTTSSGNVVFTGLQTNIEYGVVVYADGYRLAYPNNAIVNSGTSNQTVMYTLIARPSSNNFNFIAPFSSMSPPSFGVNQHFSWRFYGGLDYHTGIDISKNAAGTTFGSMTLANRPMVRNTRAGTVNTRVNTNPTTGLGNYVQMISYVGSTAYYVTYAHLDSVASSVPAAGSSTTYPQSSDIGKVGTSGDSTGVHLHISYSTTSSTAKTSRNFIDPAACFDFKYAN